MNIIALDRDGVINVERQDYIVSPSQWEPIPGSLEAIARLTEAGYRIAIASNQAGLAKNRLDWDDLNAIHRKMLERTRQAGGKIDAVFLCPHGPTDGCNCRKPQPGLLLDIARRYHVGIGEILFVGDSLRDIQAAREAGALPVLVRTGHGAQTQAHFDPALADVPVYDDLKSFATVLVTGSGR